MMKPPGRTPFPRFAYLGTPASPRPTAGELGRRELLRRLALGLAALPVARALAACTDAGDDTAAGPDAGGTDGTIGGSAWASGGTAAMTDKASYPDPFTAALTSCAVVTATTEGPCTTATDLAREDVSEGWSGLPVRLILKVVDAACQPVVGATVKIWHTNKAGVYSGQTPNPGMCSNNDAAVIAQDFFRGVQTTDADGVVGFDTCFPGWYRGRAVHVHFQVKTASTSYKISQLFFPEDVTAAIFASHGEYASYGQPDTRFASDTIVSGIGAAKLSQHVFTVARMTDGAMLASKVVAVTG